jgi:hypothetical protein
LFDFYQETIRHHKKLPLKRERKLIALAKKGDSSAQNKILLHLIGFFSFRIKTTLFPLLQNKYGEDILQDCLLLAAKNISTYKLRYKNKAGKFQPVHLSTYMWKGITGLIFNYVKGKEINFSDLPDWTIKKYE